MGRYNQRRICSTPRLNWVQCYFRCTIKASVGNMQHESQHWTVQIDDSSLTSYSMFYKIWTVLFDLFYGGYVTRLQSICVIYSSICLRFASLSVISVPGKWFYRIWVKSTAINPKGNTPTCKSGACIWASTVPLIYESAANKVWYILTLWHRGDVDVILELHFLN